MRKKYKLPENYKLPKRKKNLLTDEFLKTFKEELDKVFNIKPENNPTYWTDYTWLESSCGFYDALKTTCEKHNLKKAIYQYALNLGWYHGDQFDYELTQLMIDRGIIEEGKDETDFSEEQLKEMEERGEIRWVEDVRKYKDYSVTNRYWEYV